MKKKLIIDTDPGHDDAIAIMTILAESELVEILGITTVAGNQTLEKVTLNMLKILELTGFHIPVAKGEEKPLIRELETGGDAHGETGMDGPILPDPTIRALAMPGVEYLHSLIIESESPVSLLALGPLTNIAKLLTEHPEVVPRISEVSLMGGGLKSGNITEAAEFNIYVDPEAADIVYRSGLNITMSGLDVTEKAMIYPHEWSHLHKAGAASRFTAKLLDFYNVYAEKFGFPGSALHDACAAVWLLKPDLFKGKMLPVRVETNGELTRGMTVADRRRRVSSNANINVLMDVEREKFVEYVLICLSKLDRAIELIHQNRITAFEASR